MKKTMKRALGAGGALALAASAVLIPATAAQADGNYYGAWTLTAWKLNGKTIECPGSLPLPPPAPAVECKGGEYVKLKSNYRYKTNINVLGRQQRSGSFEVLKFPSAANPTIVLDSDVDADDPRAYQFKLKGSGSGLPKKLVIWSTEGGITLKMILRRDAN